MNPNTNLRIVQLIDSLEAGGAERMAVSYANALQKKSSFSGIVVTRNEGSLKLQLDSEVSYLFLDRKRILDLRAILKFRDFLKKNKVSYIQAHSTSIYFAFLIKIVLPKINIIWHDHYGKSEMLEKREKFFLKIISLFIAGIVAVNQKLKSWSEDNLFCKRVIYLANFTITAKDNSIKETVLQGLDNKRIVCLANLRPQKNHFLLLEVALKCREKHPDWTFHLIGKDFKDSYSKKIKDTIEENGLQNQVFLYGSCDDVSSILKKCQIGILTSDSEGLPVALLEYGFQKLAVVSTAVGEVSSVIENNTNGLLVNSNDVNSFTSSLISIIENPSLRVSLGAKLNETIIYTYSEEKNIDLYINWIYEK
ncbi:glycosyltransferase [Flavobacterium sp.]|uniref:glycosyltransferase n=1 Tax=Flavobacterium sp. TaxID=239 RepID=UPI002FDEEF64